MCARPIPPVAMHALALQVKQMARRLQKLEAMPDNHSHCLGPRVMAALTQLLCSNSIEQARSACEAAAWGTTYSRNACAWLVRDGALAALAHFMRSCSTNKSQSSILTAILTILVNILSHSGAVLHIEPKELAGLVPIVTDLLQLYRYAPPLAAIVVPVQQKDRLLGFGTGCFCGVGSTRCCLQGHPRCFLPRGQGVAEVLHALWCAEPPTSGAHTCEMEGGVSGALHPAAEGGAVPVQAREQKGLRCLRLQCNAQAHSDLRAAASSEAAHQAFAQACAQTIGRQ